jgi:hypothetical protein
MCKHGNTIDLEVTVPAHLSSTGKPKLKLAKIDFCIFPIVKALNEVGVKTIASCCGHGKGPGNIILEDGREIWIYKDKDELERLTRRITEMEARADG